MDSEYNFYQVKDGFGNVVGLIYPGGLKIFYTLDTQNNVTEVRKNSPKGLLFLSISYDDANRPLNIRYASGVVTEYSYDASGRVRMMTTHKGEKYLQQE